MPRKAATARRIAFVTGTRAEFGLMRTTLDAIQNHPQLQLQLIVTGMHLDARHGRSIDTIRKEGWKIDSTIPWPASRAAGRIDIARHTGIAMAAMATAFDRLKSDIILVAGDRVEPFAAAA